MILKYISTIALCAVQLVAHADCAEQKPIRKLICDSAMAQMDMMIAEIKEDGYALSSSGRKAAQAMEEDIAPAMHEAKGKAAVAAAVKEYYLAAGTYYENPAGILGKKYKADMEQKEKALQLELKLAGIAAAVR